MSRVIIQRDGDKIVGVWPTFDREFLFDANPGEYLVSWDSEGNARVSELVTGEWVNVPAGESVTDAILAR